MEECDICLTKIKKRNKNKHQPSKKHRYILSNLIINKYIVRIDEIDKFKDILQSYYDKHKRKFNIFSVWIFWEKNNEIVREIKLPDKVIVEKRCYIAPDINRITMNLIQYDVNKISKMMMGTCVDYLDTYYNFDNDFCNEISIIFISDLRDISFFHYMKQPKSMLCRKLVKNFIEEEKFEDYEYEWLPNCVKLLKI